jgi:predicted lipoprotein with Yx(FWY)xxD motif
MRTRPTSWFFVFALLLVAGVVTGFAVAGPILKSSKNDALGSTVIVNAKGLTLYHLTTERAGTISCSGICATFWIPVLASGNGKPVLGKGVIASKVGTIKRPDGRVQLTYNHYALYRYYLDKKPGQIGGEGFATGTGTWQAISTSGKLVKPKKNTSTGTSTGTTSTGGGYGY